MRCIQYKKVSQFAKEVHVTFSIPTFCTRFVNSRSLAINEKSYFTLNLSAHRPSLSLVFLMRLLNLLTRPMLNESKISTNVK